MDILHNIFSFIITLSILVTIHEFGHFWMARKQGVKVLRFSLGFGKILWHWHDRHQTEYAISLIPLGGYIKMLDEREAPVSQDNLPFTFNRKSLWARTTIVLAGPLANFILAIFALWLMYLLGFTVLSPITGDIIDHSPAKNAGMQSNEKILSIHEKKTTSWQDVQIALAHQVGQTTPFHIVTQATQTEKQYTVTIQNWPSDITQISLLEVLGVNIWAPKPAAVIGRVLTGYPAEKSGLQAGDRITHFNEVPVNNWINMAEMISKHPNKLIKLKIIRNNQPDELQLIIAENTLDNQETVGFIGAEAQPVSWPDTHLTVLSRNPFIALKKAITDTWELTCLTTNTIFKMIGGLLSLDNLSGPIAIAQIASNSLNNGLKSFLYFLALLSISLGVINLLPIPTLDGGHLLYYALELIRGRPISEKVQIFCLRIGLVCILCVMILSIYNDLNRIW
ncbi:MAG: RIP metalloprotease RseP [Endozoicomonadaceae bacterium]|nr:RIP metalloprotease RseP [Endozoicomonadaceae bacterium]